MASAAEQLAANLNWSAFSKATDLKKRIWFTLMALLVYRLGTYIPVPGIDTYEFTRIFQEQAQGLLGMFNTFTGGALGRMTIFALNVFPYITASIIMQMMTHLSPSMSELKKEGESGRKKINQYTRYLTVFLTIVQSFTIINFLVQFGVVPNPGVFFYLTCIVTFVGATVFLMWLGEQITARGIGNGISLIIFAGIVANLPSALASTMELGRTGALSTFVLIAIIALIIAVIVLVVFVERAQRRIIVQYPKRQMGNKQFAGDSSHLPLKINTSGVIPPIFASALLSIPTTITGFGAGGGWLSAIEPYLRWTSPVFMLIFVGFIVFFSFFYTAIVFNPEETADNLKKNGGFVPGIRPGKSTAQHLDKILTRLTTVGAIYLSAICILPTILMTQYGIPFYFGGTSLLIVVTVTMDTVAQIHSHLLASQYEGLIKKSRIKGRRK